MHFCRTFFAAICVALFAGSLHAGGQPGGEVKSRIEWRKLLRDPNPFVRVRALYALGHHLDPMAGEPPLVPDLVHALKDEEEGRLISLDEVKELVRKKHGISV